MKFIKTIYFIFPFSSFSGSSLLLFPHQRQEGRGGRAEPLLWLLLRVLPFLFLTPLRLGRGLSLSHCPSLEARGKRQKKKGGRWRSPSDRHPRGRFLSMSRPRHPALLALNPLLP
jgi:hypothetical protein